MPNCTYAVTQMAMNLMRYATCLFILSMIHLNSALCQDLELRSFPFGKLPAHKMELIGFRVTQDSFELKFRNKTEFLYIRGTKDDIGYWNESLPEISKRTDVLWEGMIAGERRIISESHEGLGQRVIHFTDPVLGSPIRLFNANRSQGIFPRISFERTDSSLLLWYGVKGERDNSNSILHFYEIGIDGDQLKYWQVELPFEFELTEIYRVHRAGSSIIFALKIYRISPIDKRGGQVNYRWLVAINPIGESRIQTIELEKEDLFTGTPLIQFTDSSLILLRTRSYLKASWQREIECMVMDLKSGKQTKIISALDSLDIPKNAFTYSRSGRSYVNFLPIRLEETRDGLTALLEYRHIELEGRRGNEPLYSYFLGPLVVVHVDLINQEMRGSTIEKYQYSQGDDAIYSGAFILDRGAGRRDFFFSSRLGNFLGIRFTLPINRKAHLYQSISQSADHSIRTVKIRTDRSRYAPIWRYAVEREGHIYVPMRRGKEVRIGTML